jgi:hypothetical protein
MDNCRIAKELIRLAKELVNEDSISGRRLGGIIPGLSSMKLNQIAQIIAQDWGSKVNYAAKPYLEAMFSLINIEDNYYLDSGESIVAYFLSNASSWRGPVAKEVKNELKKRLR